MRHLLAVFAGDTPPVSASQRKAAMIAQSIRALRRLPSRAEFLADDIVHIIGLTAGISGAVVAIVMAAFTGRPLEIVSVSIYGAALVTMLACSALYNMRRTSRRRDLLGRLDHAGIFLMIAGSYTPFALVALGGAWGWSLVGVVWAGALGGAVLKLFQPRWFEPFALPLYLGLGWLILVAIGPMAAAVGAGTLTLIAIGGALYTIGVVFHLWERLPFQQAVWHVFVLAAAAVHYAALMAGVLLAPA